MRNGLHRLVLTFLLATAILVLSGRLATRSAAGIPKAPTAASPYLRWNRVTSPVTVTLNSVSMVSASEGWAVGEQGAVLHYDGQVWAGTTYTATARLLSVSMSSSGSGWVVGYDIIPPGSRILRHWNGTVWEPVASPVQLSLLREASAPQDASAWLAGGFYVCGPESVYPQCDPEYAEGVISHWDGSTWSNTQTYHKNLSSISMVSDTEGWAVGTEVVEPDHQLRSAILHWNGTYWEDVAHPGIEDPGGTLRYILEEVSALNATVAWTAVSNQNILLRWDGAAWTQVYSPVGGRPAVAPVSSGDAWEVGKDGMIAHWDGSTWTAVSSPVTSTLTSVDMVSASEGWAVGENGIILHYAEVEPALVINYTHGKPGSFFTITGLNFPYNGMATVSINGYALTSVPTGTGGIFKMILNTEFANEGCYLLTASSAGKSASVIFFLDDQAPMRLREGSGLEYYVPGPIAYPRSLHLPVITR